MEAFWNERISPAFLSFLILVFLKGMLTLLNVELYSVVDGRCFFDFLYNLVNSNETISLYFLCYAASNCGKICPKFDGSSSSSLSHSVAFGGSGLMHTG